MNKTIIEKKIKEIKSKYIITSSKNDKNIHFKMLSEIVQLRMGKIKEGEVYINNITKMTFIDKLGREFKMIPNSIKNGHWSPYESGQVRDPEYHMKHIEEIVLSKGGIIKEGEVYVNTNTKMIFIDKFGNEFKMTPNAIKNGNWSPYESDNVHDPEYHMKELEEIVLSKGGKIKEGEVYINAHTKMTFIDQLGNEFKMRPNDIKNGQWSLYEINCSEHICRQIIEQLYNKEFPSSWSIVKREGKKNLQLDGYNAELNIAFEYQGKQHTTGWRCDEESLIEIQERDKEKKQICIENDILLLEINYYKTTKDIQDLINQTINDVKKSYEVNNKKIPDFIDNVQIGQINIDLSKISHLVLMQKQLEEIVSSKEGKIKEGEVYVNAKTKMTFIDKLGREFKKTPDAIRQGYWSPYESGKVYDPQYHMNEIKKIVSSKEGKIKEGEVYVNGSTKMTFIDKSGREFKMIPNAVKNGSWSPYESGKVHDPEYHMRELEKIVSSKEGKIKEGQVYLGSNTKMTFIDKLGREFKMTPSSVKRGSWSPYESGLVRDSDYHMKELEEIVLSKEGKIKEGEVYVNAKTKMTFIDKSGREFNLKPNAIKKGCWSPYESGNVRDPEYHMKELEEIVLSKEGKIKEGEVYVNNSTKMSFIDKSDNEFKMRPSDIKKGCWSPYESGLVRDPEYHMKKLNEIVLLREGKIKEGEVYVNAKTKMTFIDKSGNEFKKTPSDIKSGYWSLYENKNIAQNEATIFPIKKRKL